MNWLRFRNNWLKLENSGELPIILEESIEYTSNEWKRNRKLSTCNHRLDLESLGSWPTLYAPKTNFPGTEEDLVRYWQNKQYTLSIVEAFGDSYYLCLYERSRFFLTGFDPCLSTRDHMVSSRHPGARTIILSAHLELEGF